MANSIDASALFREIPVDLWGPSFRVKETTRSIEAALNKHAEKEFDESDNDAAFNYLAELLDILLEPIDGTERAKTVLKRKYKADEIGVSHVTALVDRVTEARAESARPT